jgi:hypothetical protein
MKKKATQSAKYIPSQTNWTNVPDDWDQYEGFVYLITNTITQQKYIGRKYFWTKQKTKIVGESDWRKYKSSSSYVKEEIQKYGEDVFKFEIISVHRSRQETNYAEVKEQFARNVLEAILPNGLEEYYNHNILSRYFKPKEFGTPEYEQKCQNISASLRAAYASGRIKHGLKDKVHPKSGEHPLKARNNANKKSS